MGLKYIKDELGSSVYNDDGIVQRAVKEHKKSKFQHVCNNRCMCQYTSHGHCGILDKNGNVLNDETLEYLSKIALSHVKAGADMVAPSDMLYLALGQYLKHLEKTQIKKLLFCLGNCICLYFIGA